jgi:hypothetical protein
MTTQDIQTLLDKYFEGESTLVEEAQLKAYFQGDQIDENLKIYSEFFQFLDEEKNQQTLRPDFEKELLAEFAKEDKPLRSAKIRQLPSMLLRIAAVVVLMVGLYFLVPQQDDQLTANEFDWSSVEMENEQEAFEQTKAALELLASKLNGSSKTATQHLQNVEKINNILK